MTTEIIVPNFINVLFALLGRLARVAVEFLSFSVYIYPYVKQFIRMWIFRTWHFQVPGYLATWAQMK